MTLVIATGGIDLSVGSLMAISGALAPIIFLGKLLRKMPETRRRRRGRDDRADRGRRRASAGSTAALITRFRMQPIVATLVLFIAGRGIAQV